VSANSPSLIYAGDRNKCARDVKVGTDHSGRGLNLVQFIDGAKLLSLAVIALPFLSNRKVDIEVTAGHGVVLGEFSTLRGPP
jgi:hypothetical protein